MRAATCGKSLVDARALVTSRACQAERFRVVIEPVAVFRASSHAASGASGDRHFCDNSAFASLRQLGQMRAHAVFVGAAAVQRRFGQADRDRAAAGLSSRSRRPGRPRECPPRSARAAGAGASTVPTSSANCATVRGSPMSRFCADVAHQQMMADQPADQLNFLLRQAQALARGARGLSPLRSAGRLRPCRCRAAAWRDTARGD